MNETLADRRDFGKPTLKSLLTFALLETVFCSNAIADAVKPIAVNWLSARSFQVV